MDWIRQRKRAQRKIDLLFAKVSAKALNMDMVHLCECVVLTNCVALLEHQLYRALPVLDPEVEQPGLTLYDVSGRRGDWAKS